MWGRSLPVEDAARLLGDLPTARVLHAARQAADNGLLTSGEPGVDFAHALVRNAVYADINLAVRGGAAPRLWALSASYSCGGARGRSSFQGCCRER